MTFSTPVDITAGTTYVASYYAPRGHYSTSSGVLLRAEPLRREHARQPAAPRHQRERRRCQRRLLLRGRYDVPDVDLQRRELRGRRRLHAEAPAGPGGHGHGDARARAPRLSTSPRRSRAARPRATSVTPFIGSTAQPPVTVDGQPAVDLGQGHRASTPATSYTFKVQAANGSGSGPLSPASNAVTPTPPTAPGAPTGLIPSAGNQQVTLRWTAPTDGGATITRYTVTPYLNGVAQATTDGDRIARADDRGRDRPDQRLPVHVHRDGGELGRHRAPASAPSSAATPSAAPQFVQRVSGRSPSGPSLVADAGGEHHRPATGSW